MSEVTVHNMPSVFVMETQIPESMVNDLNNYLDEYKEDQDKQLWGYLLRAGQKSRNKY